MSDLSPLDAVPDPTLGRVLRMALDRPHDGAFVARVRVRLVRADRGWDEVLSGWFWQGLAAASLVAAFAAGYAVMSPGATAADAQESVAVQLLDGQSPGPDLLLTSLAGNR